jgi:hypothetical protein
VSELSGTAVIEINDGCLKASDIKGNLIARITNGSLRAEKIVGLITVKIASGSVILHDVATDVHVSAQLNLSEDLNANLAVENIHGEVITERSSAIVRKRGDSDYLETISKEVK